MRKSTIATLIVSILLIILGFVLVACGIASSYSSVEYHFGRAVYFQSSYMNYSLQSKLLTSFGQMSFIMGIAGIFLFAFLAIKNSRAEGSEKKKDEKPSASVHYEDRSAEAEDVKETVETVESVEGVEESAPAEEAEAQRQDGETTV